ncbi:MAG: hypothetical protein KJZ78_30010 [Bryobacteraceae bacterium]|nr:hypothetical protein [Bryobacteraceae bacterium]
MKIRTLVQEITELSKHNMPPREFCKEFLSRVVAALAAGGGAIWAVNGSELAPRCQINPDIAVLLDNAEDQAGHIRLLRQVLSAGRGVLVQPRSGGEDRLVNPTDLLLILAPLRAGTKLVGIVEIYQRPNAAPMTQKGYLRFVVQMCEIAGGSPVLGVL